MRNFVKQHRREILFTLFAVLTVSLSYHFSNHHFGLGGRARKDLVDGRIEKAVEKASELLRIDAENASARLTLARAYLALDREDVAIRETELSLQGLNEKLFMAHLDLARLYLKRSNLAVARDHLERALELQPEDSELLMLAGLISEKQNRPLEAKKYYRSAVKNNAITPSGIKK